MKNTTVYCQKVVSLKSCLRQIGSSLSTTFLLRFSSLPMTMCVSPFSSTYSFFMSTLPSCAASLLRTASSYSLLF